MTTFDIETAYASFVRQSLPKLAKRHAGERQDLWREYAQDAALTVWDAAGRYDSSKAAFATFATAVAKNAMRQATYRHASNGIAGIPESHLRHVTKVLDENPEGEYGYPAEMTKADARIAQAIQHTDIASLESAHTGGSRDEDTPGLGLRHKAAQLFHDLHEDTRGMPGCCRECGHKHETARDGRGCAECKEPLEGLFCTRQCEAMHGTPRETERSQRPAAEAAVASLLASVTPGQAENLRSWLAVAAAAEAPRYKDIAKHRGVTKQAVSKSLKPLFPERLSKEEAQTPLYVPRVIDGTGRPYTWTPPVQQLTGFPKPSAYVVTEPAARRVRHAIKAVRAKARLSARVYAGRWEAPSDGGAVWLGRYGTPVPKTQPLRVVLESGEPVWLTPEQAQQEVCVGARGGGLSGPE